MPGIHAQERIRRLAGQEHHFHPARKERRLRPQYQVPIPSRGKGRGRRRQDYDRLGGRRPYNRRRMRHGGPDEPGRHRLRLRGGGARPLGQSLLGHAGAAGNHRDQRPAGPNPQGRQNVDLLVPGGGNAGRGPGGRNEQRGQAFLRSSTWIPTRPCTPARTAP